MKSAPIDQQVNQQEYDLALLKRIQNRDADALSELHDRYARLLYALSVRILSTTQDAEDILQEAFLLIWDKAQMYLEGRGTVYTWMVSVCRNKAIDRLRSKNYRQQKKQVDIEPLENMPSEDIAADPHESLVWQGHRRLIATALSSLDEGQREVLELSYFGGLSQAEIADKLRVPLGTVKTRMRLGLAKIRLIVQKETDK